MCVCVCQHINYFEHDLWWGSTSAVEKPTFTYCRCVWSQRDLLLSINFVQIYGIYLKTYMKWIAMERTPNTTHTNPYMRMVMIFMIKPIFIYCTNWIQSKPCRANPIQSLSLKICRCQQSINAVVFYLIVIRATSTTASSFPSALAEAYLLFYYASQAIRWIDLEFKQICVILCTKQIIAKNRAQIWIFCYVCLEFAVFAIYKQCNTNDEPYSVNTKRVKFCGRMCKMTNYHVFQVFWIS